MKLMCAVILFCTLKCLCFSQWFDEQAIFSTVLIEKQEKNTFIPHGTGFALWNYHNTEHTVIITCRHILARSEIFVTVNADSSFVRYAERNGIDTVKFDKLKWALSGGKFRARVSLTAGTNKYFVVDSILEIGAFLIDLPSRITLDSDTAEKKVAKLMSISRSKIRHRKDVRLGDELFFVGFPFGIGTEDPLEPLVRSGSVAWLSSNSKEFLLDAFSFGGNSGSPVFSKIILGRKPGTLAWDDAYLVGMVFGHLGDSASGVLVQTNPLIPMAIRTDLELQNYGLARCVWIDDILPIADKATKLDIGE